MSRPTRSSRKSTTSRSGSSPRSSRQEEELPEVELINSISEVEENPFMKMLMYGKTGCGTTYGALHVLRTKQFEGDVIVINTDIHKNLYDNVMRFTEEERKRLFIPRDSSGQYMRVNTPARVKAVKAALIKEYGERLDEKPVAAVILDYSESVYDGYIDHYDPQTPFAYGKPRKEFKKDLWDWLMKANTNFIVLAKEIPVYVDTGAGEQFQKHQNEYICWLEKSAKTRQWLVDFNTIIYRETRRADDRMGRFFVSVFEKHKLGLQAFELSGRDSNLFNEIYSHFLKAQEALAKDPDFDVTTLE
jgi:hypothetical protein